MARGSDPRAAADAIREMLNNQFPAAVTYLFPTNQPVVPERPSVPSDPPDRPAASGENYSHSPDFSSVRWPDPNDPAGFQIYTFTTTQRPIVSMLWEAMENGTHFVGSAALLEAAEASSGRMVDVFRNSKAWKRLIVSGLVSGGPAGTYRLAPIGGDRELDGAA